MLSVNVRKDALWFLDLDGTLAEWKKGKEHELKAPGYYRNLRPTQFLKPFREFASKNRGRAFILSVYFTDCMALQDKQDWVDEFIPEIRPECRIFVPFGEDKAEYVKKTLGISSLTDQMVLFDDFSFNLHNWQSAGGKGVKCYNGINGNHGTWTGDGAMWSEDIRVALRNCTN